MKFEEALPLLKRGKRIRRAYWPEGVYLRERCGIDFYGETYYDVEETSANDDILYDPYESSWFCSSDLFEEDWEVVE